MIRIWLPPEFAPEINKPANQLLKARLEKYAAEHPDIRLEVRVKALEGAGGMLEALVAANTAAPLALPDLVLLPRALLESAALKGLLYSYDGLTSAIDDSGWFDYANQLAHLKASTYGLPFAGDALVLAYHPSLVEATPHDLETALSLGEVLLIPASDPQAIFTLGMYLAKGESLQDAAGRPALDKATLTGILEFDQQASLVGVMPYWLSQYSDDGQVWDTFIGDQFPMAVMWASTYLKHRPGTTADLALASIPTPGGFPFTLATGWSWALAGQDPQRRLLSTQLAETLVENEFLAQWTYEAGYLPPRVDALQSWQDPALRKIIEQISFSAHLVPPADMISSLGPALQQAVVDMIKDQSDPQTAAQTIIDQIGSP
jgi:ABC-type glycerol-3-phosphate transport system substrate-binding protein